MGLAAGAERVLGEKPVYRGLKYKDQTDEELIRKLREGHPDIMDFIL